jgi:hypothetical protein
VDLETRGTPQDQAKCTEGTIKDWVKEGLRLAQTTETSPVKDPGSITPAYQYQDNPVIGIRLEKAGVRLAYLWKAALKYVVVSASLATPISVGA